MTAPSTSLVREGFGRRAAVAALIAVALAVGLVVATADGPDAISGGLGGDFASFYAAGDIVLDDPGLDPERFYEPERQFDAQEPVRPSDAEGHLYFAYPAFFAAPFVPLAALDFRLAYLVNVLLMTAALAAALALLRPCSRVVREHGVEVFAASLTFYPMFRGITGGQNTALSVLLFAVVWRSLHDGKEVPAGLAAGLLLFKPPLALPVIGGLLLARRYQAVAASVATTVALYAIGVVLTGPGWPSAWIDAVRYLDEVDTPFNVQNFVSIPGAAEAIFGIDSVAAAVVGYGLALVAAAVVAWVWFRRLADPAVLVALAATGALVISPHALYYDAGILVIAGIVLVDRRVVDARWLVLLWAFGLSHLLADALGFSPLVVVAAGVFLLTAYVAVGRGRTGEGQPNPRPTPAGSP